MAVSLYPKEGNPLWEEYSTKAVVQTLRAILNSHLIILIPKQFLFMPKSGMEYPQICFNPGRPDLQMELF